MAIFGVHWSSVSADVTYLTRHVTWQDHVIEESCYDCHLRYHLAKFGGRKYGGNKDMLLLICHVIS